MRTVIVVLALAAAACDRSAPARTQSSTPAGPPAVDATRVVQQALTVNLEMPGELAPYESVAIFPKVTGFVRSVRVDRGSHVKAGELLARLDAPEIVAQRGEAASRLQSAEAQVAVTRSKTDADASTLDRLKAASATPGVVAGNDIVLAQKGVEGDRNQIAAAEKNVEAARQALDSVTQMENYLNITAPFEGQVTERNIHPGALVSPPGGAESATPMFRVVDRRRLRLVVPVPEPYVGGVSDGTAIMFTVSAYPGQTFSGRIARMADVIDERTRTMPIEIDVVNDNGQLAPGAYCQVQWPVHRQSPSLLVPSASVASTTGRTFVVRIRNDKIDWVDVKTGLTSGPLVEVFGDLRPGDQIATRGTDELRPGTDVRVKQPGAAK